MSETIDVNIQKYVCAHENIDVNIQEYARAQRPRGKNRNIGVNVQDYIMGGQRLADKPPGDGM